MTMTTESVGTLTIANGAATSNRLSDILSAGQMKVLAGALEQLSILGPAALTNAVAVEVSTDCPGTDFEPLEDYQGNGIAIPAATVTGIPYVAWKDLRLVAAANEGAQRDFKIVAKLNVSGG